MELQEAAPTLPGGPQPLAGGLERDPLCGELLPRGLSHKVTSVPQLMRDRSH